MWAFVVIWAFVVCTTLVVQDIGGKQCKTIPTRDCPPKSHCSRFTFILITVDYRYRHIPAASLKGSHQGLKGKYYDITAASLVYCIVLDRTINKDGVK